MFLWYHANGDGTASVHKDTAEVRAKIDAREPGWFGSPEGAIVNGGVVATAFSRKTEEVFDVAAWLFRDERVSNGFITVTKITAERAP